MQSRRLRDGAADADGCRDDYSSSGINTNGGADRSGWCPRAERFSCFGMYGEWAIRERVVGVLGKSGKEIENRRL